MCIFVSYVVYFSASSLTVYFLGSLFLTTQNTKEHKGTQSVLFYLTLNK